MHACQEAGPGRGEAAFILITAFSSSGAANASSSGSTAAESTLAAVRLQNQCGSNKHYTCLASPRLEAHVYQKYSRACVRTNQRPVFPRNRAHSSVGAEYFGWQAFRFRKDALRRIVRS